MTKFYLLLEIPVRGTYKTNIYLYRCHTSNAQQFLLLDNPQQFYLHRQGHFSNLIKEQGAAVRHLNESLFGPFRSCKSALFMAEKIIGQKFFCKGAAIKRQHRPLAPHAVMVNKICKQLLSCA